MPRTVKDTDHSEDMMDDVSYENWETISEGFGTKIEWTVGTRFIGEYTGTRQVPSKEASEDGTFDMIDAAEFTKDGEKFYSWMPHQLQTVISEGTLKVGQTVFIECVKEEPTARGLNPVKVFTIKVKPS